MKRAVNILQQENVSFEKEVVAELVSRYFPDWRRVLNELQRHSATGNITSSIFGGVSGDTFAPLVSALKAKNFGAVRKWVGENSDIDSTTLFRQLYDNVSDLVTDNSIPSLILIIADYQYKAAFVADQEINTVACLTNIMSDCNFR
jgi:hypothetical protein